eukprot:591457-Prorocentrum_minimum.AAC.5
MCCSLAADGQVSYPWQYNQSQFRKSLWAMNFFLRMALNKVLPKVFSQHSFLELQQGGASYSSILQKADQTTQRILTGGSLLLLLVLAKLVGVL